jgi:hypothetical protein
MGKMYCTECRPVQHPDAVCYYEQDGRLRLAFYRTFISLPEEYDWHCTSCGAAIDHPWEKMFRQSRQYLSHGMTEAERLEMARRQRTTTHDLALRSLPEILASELSLYCDRCSAVDIEAYEFGEVEYPGGYLRLRAGDPVSVIVLSRLWPWVCARCHDPVYVPPQTAMAAAKLAADNET